MRNRGRFADASDADLEALQQAFAPVFTTLENDPQTKRFIEQIRELKQATDPGPALSVPAGCTGSADTGDTGATGTAPPSDASVDTATAALNGTYRWTITNEIFTVSLDDGIWTWPDECDTDDCTFTVDGDSIVFDGPRVAAVLEFTFTKDADGTLHLQPAVPMNPGDEFVWSTEAWEKID